MKTLNDNINMVMEWYFDEEGLIWMRDPDGCWYEIKPFCVANNELRGDLERERMILLGDLI